MRMRHIAICGLPRSTIFFHIFHKWQDFEGGKVIVQLLSETFFIQRGVIINLRWYLCKCTRYSYKTWLFSTDFRTPNLIKILTVRPIFSVPTGGRGDMTKLIFANLWTRLTKRFGDKIWMGNSEKNTFYTIFSRFGGSRYDMNVFSQWHFRKYAPKSLYLVELLISWYLWYVILFL